LRNLLLAALAILFATTALVENAHAKSRATCTRLVKAKPDYLTPGGRCGEECRAAINLCVKGKKI
jgi:hypothetical protein